MRSICLRIQKCFASLPLTPASMDEEPCSWWDTAMLLFPCLNPLNGQQEIRRLLHVSRNIYHTGRTNKLAGQNRISRIIGQIFARYPVNRCIEVGARVFTECDDVPVPGRAA